MGSARRIALRLTGGAFLITCALEAIAPHGRSRESTKYQGLTLEWYGWQDQRQILDLTRKADPTATTRLTAQTSRPNSTNPSAAKPQRKMNTRSICTCLSLDTT